MTARTIAITEEARIRITAPRLPMLWMQTKSQAMSFWRAPSVCMTGLVMPLMLFIFFVLPHAHDTTTGSVTVGPSMLAAIAAYAVSSMMVFNFGVTVAVERGQKVDLLARAMPLPGWIYLGARVICALIFATLALGLLVAAAVALGGITLDPATWTSMVARILVGALPFIGFGFAIAYLTSPSSAPAVANLAFIGLAFASGMFVPLDQMPDFMRTIAPALPTYHYTQLVLSAVGAGSESQVLSVTWLVAYTVALFGLAVWAYRRESRRRFS